MSLSQDEMSLLDPSLLGASGTSDTSGYDSSLLLPGADSISGTDTLGSVDAIGGPPASSDGSSLSSILQSGLSAFNSAANIGLGVYKSVANTQQQTGQPERLPDGRYVQNIQGKPTLLTASNSVQANSSSLLLIAAVLAVVVLLAKG